jgi:hypothetical protein
MRDADAWADAQQNTGRLNIPNKRGVKVYHRYDNRNEMTILTNMGDNFRDNFPNAILYDCVALSFGSSMLRRD